MAGGADAARHAAQLTLLDSDFSVMPEIVLEGRRVINNITRAASLFLTKTLFSFFLSILTLLLPASYPFHPIHLTLISSLTVGIPGFFLALEPCHERIRGSFLRTVLLRALPGGAAVTLCGALAMILVQFGWTKEMCSTVATMVAWFVGFLVLLRTCMPLNRNRTILLVAMAAAFVLAVLITGKHSCMTARGIRNMSSETVTLTVRGAFETDHSLKDQVLALVPRQV
jgi:cation-transporting ATPase E